MLPVHRPHRVGVLRAVGHVGVDPAGGFSRSDGLNPGPAGLTGLLPVDPVAGGVGHRPPPHLDAGCGIFQPGEHGPDGGGAARSCSWLWPAVLICSLGSVGHFAVGQGQAAGGCTLGHQVVVSVPSWGGTASTVRPASPFRTASPGSPTRFWTCTPSGICPSPPQRGCSNRCSRRWP